MKKILTIILMIIIVLQISTSKVHAIQPKIKVIYKEINVSILEKILFLSKS